MVDTQPVNEEIESENSGSVQTSDVSRHEENEETVAGVETQDDQEQLVKENKPKNDKFRWYVVHTYSGYEEKAKIALQDRIENAGMQDKFGEMIIPTSVSETTTKTGKKKTVVKTKFPGYLLVEMEMTDDTLTLVKNTPRISGFLGSEKKPVPLRPNEVLRYTQPDSEEAKAEQAVVEQQAYERGETVKVIDGPFSNFSGVVDEVKPDKARLRILVSIFGRETPVELEYSQVEKIS